MSAQIVLENIGVRFPSRVLFSGVNWTLYDGMRVALAGRNGCGKSTLLKIMAGEFEASEGQRSAVGKVRLGFLDQSLLDRAITDNQENAKPSVNYLIERMHAALPDLEEAECEWECRRTLAGLGFTRSLMEAPMRTLSGGWLLRVFIGDVLIKRPQVLLLDEPTNHLDISSIQWLEEFLKEEYEGSLVIVTHDVALQQRTTDSLAVVHGGRFYFRTHQKDYLTFRESLKDEKRLVEKSIEGTQEKIDDNMAFYEKFRAKAQTAARAQSKLRVAERFTEELNELKERLLAIEGTAYNLSLRFRISAEGSKFPVSVKDLEFHYEAGKPSIIKNVSFDLKRGARIGIMGDNGAGKTTLLNLLAQRLTPTGGTLQIGANVELGYFGQHQLDELSLDDSVLDNLRSVGRGMSLEQIRGLLGGFGFSGTAVDKKAKVLSGGERARLAMLRIIVRPHNVILLDEPTNHLDIETKELLADAIRNFEGTTIFVSHDREFVEKLCDRILYLTTDHKLTDHLGDLDSFFAKFPQFVRHLEGHKAKLSQIYEKPVERAAPALSFEERKKIKNQIKSFEKKVSALETEMETLTAEKRGIEHDSTQMARNNELDQIIHAKMVEWERLSSELEILRTKFGG
ncbi:MAG: ABC-F family ATP-binding cassette domain-containing protein [Deltaproteobacteria bacterium]|nr:ABC-F family ATP-binding cassette domain-containing protein [Deltaproteobacteria bacterium]MBI3294658.1 ABC-F family ATP-binding cassette domain-containing protein [Deltaproteobacteria bacterium]